MSNPSNADIKDALAKVLYDIVTKGERVLDKETGEVVTVTPGAAMLAVVRAYVKDHPTLEVPVANSTTGLLANYVAGKPLPFAGPSTEQ